MRHHADREYPKHAAGGQPVFSPVASHREIITRLRYAMTAPEIPASVIAHSRFFDHLVEMIPARFYHEEEAPAKLRYVPKEERANEIQLRKEKSKAARLARMDPSKARTSLQIQQDGAKESTETAREAASGAAGPPREQPQQRGVGNGSEGRLGELREKLQKRMQALRDARKADEKKEQLEKARQFREKSTRKQQQQHPPQSKKRKASEAAAGASEEKEAAGEERLTYGALDFGTDDRRPKQRRKKSKADLLKDAEGRSLQQAEMQSTTEGQAQLQKEAWGSALARAKGDKVFDDPKLLRKSLKKAEKKRGKSAAAWKDRNQQQRKDINDRQKKRRENLQARSQAKQQKKIARREKKLMRPGFEGRRDTFINGP